MMAGRYARMAAITERAVIRRRAQSFINAHDCHYCRGEQFRAFRRPGHYHTFSTLRKYGELDFLSGDDSFCLFIRTELCPGSFRSRFSLYMARKDDMDNISRF